MSDLNFTEIDLTIYSNDYDKSYHLFFDEEEHTNLISNMKYISQNTSNKNIKNFKRKISKYKEK